MFKYQKILDDFWWKKYPFEDMDSTLIKYLEEDLKQVAPGNYRLVYVSKPLVFFDETTCYDIKVVFDDTKEATMWFLKWS